MYFEHDDRSGHFEKLVWSDERSEEVAVSRLSSIFTARYFRATLIVLALLAALMMGFAVPTLAAPPAQAPDPAVTPDALASAIIVLVGLLITFVSGGGISVLLEMFPKWTAWQSPAKGYIVIALSILLVAALTSAKVLATPVALAGVPDWALAFLGSVVFSLTALFGTQLTYKRFLK